ncbi:hypothetical protein DFH11DRAFT_1686888 [Phellopilus nigrolimitatus]|nr:hypothetical protein DFH11DRAFT_1686888 [Phellopilus nigrolimitatus]
MGIFSYLITPLVIVVVAAAAAIGRSHCRPLPSSPLPPNSRCSARQLPLTTEALAQYLDLSVVGPGIDAQQSQMSGQSPLAESGRTNGHAAHERHARASHRARRLRDGKEQRPAVQFGKGMTDVGGGVPPLLPGTPALLNPAAGSPAGLAVPAHIQGILPTTSLSSSRNSPTPSTPMNSAAAPSGSGAASTTGLPPLPANVQVNPSVTCMSAVPLAQAHPGAVRRQDPGGPGVDGAGPHIRGTLPRDGQYKEKHDLVMNTPGAGPSQRISALKGWPQRIASGPMPSQSIIKKKAHMPKPSVAAKGKQKESVSDEELEVGSEAMTLNSEHSEILSSKARGKRKAIDRSPAPTSRISQYDSSTDVASLSTKKTKRNDDKFVPRASKRIRSKEEKLDPHLHITIPPLPSKSPASSVPARPIVAGKTVAVRPAIRRVWLIVREPPPAVSSPLQRPRLPRFNRSLRALLTSYNDIDGQEYSPGGLERKAAESLKKRRGAPINRAHDVWAAVVTILRLVLGEWKKDVFHVGEEERCVLDAEGKRRGRQHLDAILNQSGQILNKQQMELVRADVARSRSGTVSVDDDEAADEEDKDEGGSSNEEGSDIGGDEDASDAGLDIEDANNTGDNYIEFSVPLNDVDADMEESVNLPSENGCELQVDNGEDEKTAREQVFVETESILVRDNHIQDEVHDFGDMGSSKMSLESTPFFDDIHLHGGDELQLDLNMDPPLEDLHSPASDDAHDFGNDNVIIPNISEVSGVCKEPLTDDTDTATRSKILVEGAINNGPTETRPPSEFCIPQEQEGIMADNVILSNGLDGGEQSAESHAHKSEVITVQNKRALPESSPTPEPEPEWEAPPELQPYAVARVDWSPEMKLAPPLLLRGTLRRYQQSGLEWLATLHNNQMNGIWQMKWALGAVLLDWEMEFKKFLPGFKILIYHGTTKRRKELRQGWNTKHAFNVCVTSNTLASRDQHIFKRKAWYYMILDEAHKIKNFKSQRWNILLVLRSFRRLLLTGTPLQNNLTELWALLQFFMSGTTFANLKDFGEWFASPLEKAIEQGNIQDQEVQIQVTKLHTVLRPYLLRRLKRDVEKELLSKYDHLVLCRFSCRNQTREDLKSGVYQKIANILMQLRKVCNHPDLFEVRPVVTSFAMDRSAIAAFEIKELLVRCMLLQDDDWFSHVNLDILAAEVIAAYPGEPPPRDTRTIEGYRKYRRYQLRAATYARFSQMVYLNRLRCDQIPIYGVETIEIARRLCKPLTSACETELLSSDGQLSRTLVKSYSARAEDAANIIDKFAFAIPAVVARDLPSIVLRGLPEDALQHCSPDFDSVLHRASVKLQIAFPDVSLLQYDCGKLQELARLLRERKSGIFTQTAKILDILEMSLNFHGYLYLRLDGATKIEDRQYITERFNVDERIFAFIASSRSDGV